MKKIKLTQGQVALVDDDRYEELNQWKWAAQWSSRTQSYYAYRTIWSPKKSGKPSRRIYMHRYLMGEPKGMLVDHEDHDTLNNTSRNLRVATRSQNAWNSRLFKNNALGLKHISIATVVNRQGHVYKYLRVQFRLGQDRWLKYFKDLDEAIRVRDAKLLEMHGEFACGTGCAE